MEGMDYGDILFEEEFVGYRAWKWDDWALDLYEDDTLNLTCWIVDTLLRDAQSVYLELVEGTDEYQIAFANHDTYEHAFVCEDGT